MITETDFLAEFKRMVNLCGYVATSEKARYFYDAVKWEDERFILNGINLMIEEVPSKLTLKSLRSYINQVKPSKDVSDWNEKPCSDERCSRGIIREQIGMILISFRCTKCNSSKLMFIADHTEDNILKEQNKIKTNNKGEQNES